MRDLPDILDRHSLLPVGIVVTVLLTLWALVRTALASPAPPPQSWQTPLWTTAATIGLASITAFLQILRCAGLGFRSSPRATQLGIAATSATCILPALLLILMWQTNRPDVAGTARILLLLAAWAALWTALAEYLRGATLTFACAILGVPAAMLIAWALVHPDVPPALGRDITVGALMLTLLLGTIGTIIWAGSIEGPPTRKHLALGWLGMVLLVDGLGAWLLALAWDSGTLGFWHVVKLYLLMIGWLGFWTALALLLRRWGPGPAVILPITLSLLLLSLPATIVPLHRALQAPGGVAAARAADYAAYSCGTLGALNAVSDALPFSWTQGGGRVMYGLTTLGQDAPWPVVIWWRQLLVLLSGAVLLGAASLFPRRR